MKNPFLRSTQTIHAFLLIILKIFKIDFILKHLRATKLFKCFKFRINLKLQLFVFPVRIVELKSPGFLEASTLIPFLSGGDLKSVLVVSC